MPDPSAAQRLEDAIAAGHGARAELARRRPDGGLCWVDVGIEPIRTEDGALDGFVVVETDVTAAREHTRRL
jgi:PAS domain S-box-containing protein